VISIEHIAKTPSVETGLFATLRACLHGAGSGASSLDRRLTSTMLATLCALAGVLVFAAAPTFAARGHAFGSSFGEKGSGNGQFEEPSGVAVSEASGDVYVVDKGNNRVEYFSASGTYLGQFNGSGLLLNEGKAAGSSGLPNEIPTGQFSSPEGIAIDNSCQLHKPALTEATTPTCAEVDPSDGDVYVADTNNKVVDKFSATGEYVGQLTQTPSGVFEELYGIAVDAGGHVFVQKRNLGNDRIGGDAAEFDDSFVNVFVADNEFTIGFEGFPVAGPAFAVDSQDESYMLGRLSAEEEFVNKQQTNGEHLFAMRDTEQPTGLAVDLSSNELYVDHVGVVTRFSANLAPGDAPLERFGTGHLSGGSGIGIGPKGQTVYVADSTADVVDVFVPEPPAAPTLGATSVSDVTAEGVTVQGELNPHGASTKYRLEYGRCATPITCAGSSYEASTPVPDAQAGSSFEIQSIDVHAQGLQASTAYHARIVAANEFGGVEGEEQTFTTQAVGSAGVALADGRQWELVSPPNKHGARIFPIATGAGVFGLTQAAEAGGGIAYLADIPTEAEPPANGYGDGDQVLSVRDGEGWSTRDIATPHSSLTQINASAEYRFFVGDLSSALVVPSGLDETLLSPEASEPTPYVRTEALCEAPGTASECYRPVLTDKEGFADVPPGTKFGTNSSHGGATTVPVTLSGASPDLRHVLLKSQEGVALTTAPTAEENIYEWSADAPASEALRMVSLLPANEGGGPAPLKVNVGSSNPEIEGSDHAISNDGSRIFWQSSTGNGDNDRTGKTVLQQLYMRDTVKEETVRIDVPQAGAPPVSGQPEAMFKAANANGSTVVFTDGQRLTSNSGAEPEHHDLYECDIVEEAGKLTCRLTDLTPEISGRSADVRNVFGASTDASYVYFIADGVLSANKNSLGEEATPGTCAKDETGPAEFSHEVCGLYVYHDGAITFIANVTEAFLLAPTENKLGAGTYTSPSGRFMTFATPSRLAGYNNRDAVGRKLDSEVYLYDAQAGRLACVSCNPTGARPTGPGVLPEAPALSSPSQSGLYQPRAVSDGGRVFFDSSDGLVSQDVNSNEDVYEFEPDGTGSCTLESTLFDTKSNGCLSLISSGTSSGPSSFLDASVSGNDVFFLTGAKLTSQDVDDLGDVYDAHVCTTAVPCVTQPVPAPPCSSGDACKAAPAPQPSIFGEPASATFTGAGNVAVSPPSLGLKRRSLTRAEKLTRALRACRKKPKRARSACVRQAKKRYGASGARRAVRSTTKGQG